MSFGVILSLAVAGRQVTPHHLFAQSLRAQRPSGALSMDRSSCSKSLPNVLQQEHELERIDRGGVELEIFIKLPGGLIDCVHHHGPDSDDVSRLLDPFQCIEEEGFPEPFSLLVVIDCKSGKKDDAYGMVCKSFGDPLRALVLVDRSCSQAVVAHNAVLSTGDIGFCGVCLLV